MEKRFYLGVFLLTLLLILGLTVTIAMDAAALPIARQLEQAAREAAQGELEAGIALAHGAKSSWYGLWRRVAAVADHTPMDEIDALFAELELYLREEDRAHFGACCARLATLVEAVATAHRPTWWNLL